MDFISLCCFVELSGQIQRTTRQKADAPVKIKVGADGTASFIIPAAPTLIYFL
jgi:hypothetical protein